MRRLVLFLLSIGCLSASLLSARAGAQMQPSPPLMMAPSDSTIPAPARGPLCAGRPGAPAAIGVNASPAQAYGPGPFKWQLLPDGLMYPSYLAGEREPRIGSEWVYDRRMGWLWNIAMGARVGLLRFGTENNLLPEGFQLDARSGGLSAAATERRARPGGASTFAPGRP